MNHNIAIDGPSGAGKSTLAKKVAQKFGYIYLDTGAMYRAFGLFAIDNGVDFNKLDAEIKENLENLTEKFSLDVVYENGSQQVYANGNNVTGLIRTPEVSIAASKVAVVPKVRLKLVEIQREIASKNAVVMDGRDIGSYVLPNASVKVFLTASAEVRAQRRFVELQAKGHKDVTYDEVLSDMRFRDANDSSRAFAPLKQAEDAVLLDTSEMTEDESEEALIGIIKNKIGE